MKCSIVNKFFGACLLTAASFNSGYAEDLFLNKITDMEARCRFTPTSSSSEDPIVVIDITKRLIFAFQTRAANLKNGIESILKGQIGDEVFNVEEALTQIQNEIGFLYDYALGTPATATCNRESIRILLQNQTRLVFDYARALRDNDVAAQNMLKNQLKANLQRIKKAFTSNLARINPALRQKVSKILDRLNNQIIRMSDELHTAINITGDFALAYRIYYNLRDKTSEQLGLALGEGIAVQTQ